MVFFFFKQKTAYEMLISDWSSDVCSSDLFAQNARRRTLVRRCLRADDQRWVVMQHQIDQLLRHRGRDAATLVFGKAVARDLDMFEIGRASCRDRVCQYV